MKTPSIIAKLACWYSSYTSKPIYDASAGSELPAPAAPAIVRFSVSSPMVLIRNAAAHSTHMIRYPSTSAVLLPIGVSAPRTAPNSAPPVESRALRVSAQKRGQRRLSFMNVPKPRRCWNDG
jgi:hypothetical protein